jgi:hypothetical protein
VSSTKASLLQVVIELNCAGMKQFTSGFCLTCLNRTVPTSLCPGRPGGSVVLGFSHCRSLSPFKRSPLAHLKVSVSRRRRRTKEHSHPKIHLDHELPGSYRQRMCFCWKLHIGNSGNHRLMSGRFQLTKKYSDPPRTRAIKKSTCLSRPEATI